MTTEEDEITLAEAETMLRKAVNRVAREAARLRAAGMLSPTADAQNPILELTCKWICVHHGAAYNVNQKAVGRERDRYSAGGVNTAKTIVEDTGGPGLALWDISASVHQLADASSGTGDWSTDITEYGSFEATLRAEVHGANVADASENQPPVLRGADSIVHTGKSGVTYPGFWFKEGQLFDGDGEAVESDHTVVFESRHIFELADLTQTQTLLPFRLKLEATLNDYADPVKHTVASADSDLRLMLVAFSVIEHPQAP